MDINISGFGYKFGYKLNLWILFLLGVLLVILVGHTVCGCCNMERIYEGLTTMANDVITDLNEPASTNMVTLDASSVSVDDSSVSVDASSNIQPTQKLINLAAQTTSGTTQTTTPITSTTTLTEGFTGANINDSQSSILSWPMQPNKPPYSNLMYHLE